MELRITTTTAVDLRGTTVTIAEPVYRFINNNPRCWLFDGLVELGGIYREFHLLCRDTPDVWREQIQEAIDEVVQAAATQKRLDDWLLASE